MMMILLKKIIMIVLFFSIIFCFGINAAFATDYDNFNGSEISSGLWHINNPGVFSLSGGLLNAYGPPTLTYANMWSKYNFSGDGEFVLDYRNFSTTASVFTNNNPTIWLQVTDENNNFVSINRWRTASGHQFFTHNQSGPGPSAPASTSSGMLKIARTGSTITTYYNEGLGWNLLGTFSNSMSGDINVQVNCYTGDNGTFQAASDYITFSGFTVVPLEDSVNIKLQCPASVIAGSPLNVTQNVYNYDCFNSITASRGMVYLNGNSNGTLFGLGMWGPYNKNFSSWTIPAATCLPSFTPGTGSRSIQVISAVPSSLADTLAHVSFDFLSPSGESFGSDECWVKVSP